MLKSINVYAFIVNNYSLLKNMKVQLFFCKLGIFFYQIWKKGPILNWERSDIRTRGNAIKSPENKPIIIINKG